jgi:hypothetical protein
LLFFPLLEGFLLLSFFLFFSFLLGKKQITEVGEGMGSEKKGSEGKEKEGEGRSVLGVLWAGGRQLGDYSPDDYQGGGDEECRGCVKPREAPMDWNWGKYV